MEPPFFSSGSDCFLSEIQLGTASIRFIFSSFSLLENYMYHTYTFGEVVGLSLDKIPNDSIYYNKKINAELFRENLTETDITTHPKTWVIEQWCPQLFVYKSSPNRDPTDVNKFHI
jgi:hypothetical protein